MIRFVLKLAVFSLFCTIQIASGGPNLFFDLTTLGAGACVVLALQSLEPPLGRSLNYWDEALVFWLISHLASRISARAFLGLVDAKGLIGTRLAGFGQWWTACTMQQS
jgi:hypothetical protein